MASNALAADPWEADRHDRGRAPASAAHLSGVSALALMTKSFSPIRYIVHGYIAEGLTLLAGAPKVRKSWMMLDVAHAVAGDGYAFGSVACEHGDVLFLALEDNERRLQDRLRKMGVTEPPDRLTFCTQWPAGNEAVEAVEVWARSVENPVLVVVDVLARVREFTGRDATYEADYRALASMHELATRLGLAVVAIHHTRKSPAEDPFDEVSGTRGLTGAADTTLIIRRDNAGGPSIKATLYGRGRDIPEIETAIEFSDDDCRWKALGEAWKIADTSEQQAILDALDRPMKVKEIAALVGKSVANTSKMLGKMAKAGFISSPSYGCYGPVETVEPVEVESAWRSVSTTSTTSTTCPRCSGAGCQWCAQ